MIQHINKKWLKEGKTLKYKTYLNLVKQYAKTHKVEHEVKSVSADEFAAIKEICQENDVTVNDVLLAGMFIDEGCKKIIMAADIRSAVKNYNKSSLGNYATAFSVESNSTTDRVGAKALEIHNIVKKK